MMKKILNIISTITSLLFGIFWIISKFDFSPNFNTDDFRNGLVVIFLITGYYYYQLEIKDKNKEIKKLKKKLKKAKNTETNATEKI